MLKLKTIWQKFKRWIILVIFGGTALAAGLGADLLLEQPIIGTPLIEIPEIKVLVKNKYVHRFQDNMTGKIFEIETSQEDYEKYNKNSQPYYNNAQWVNSYGGTPVYSTSTATLLDYQYTRISGTNASSTSIVKIKIPQQAEKEINENLIPNKLLTTEAINQ